jgi:1-phosphofructokinase
VERSPGASVWVFAPSPLLTITVDEGEGGVEVHLFPVGQGYWLARLIHAMEVPVVRTATKRTRTSRFG